MKRDDITFDQKIGQLRMEFQSSKIKDKVFVFLEGETDVKLFRKLFNDNTCRIENIPGGKTKVFDCIHELLIKHDLIFGIVDADFMHLSGHVISIEKVFLTDYHDIEMMMLAEDEIFSALAFEFTDLPRDKHMEFKNEILNSIARIGYLKWLNVKEDLMLNFEFGFQDFLSFDDSNRRFVEYLKKVLTVSKNARIKNIEIILQKIEHLEKFKPNLFQLCNGHDFLKAISEYINRQRKSSGVSHYHLGSICRSNYDNKIFEKTYLYRNTKKWADDNNCVIY